MNEGQAQRLLERVIVLAGAQKAGVIASVHNTRAGNSRFAVNEITSSAEVERLSLSVTVQLGKRSATATTNQLDDRSIEDVVNRAQRMAKLSPENPETMPPLGKQTYKRVPIAADGTTEGYTPAERAKHIGAAIAAAKTAKVTIAGFYEHSTEVLALASSAGLSAFHQWTNASLSCTARTSDGTGSGWAGAQSNRVADFDASALAKVAVDKAVASQKPKKLEPGRYTVVLEPAAVAGLMEFLTEQLGARRADEGRSFFSKTGGATKLGDKLFPDMVNLRTDPADAGLASPPFDGEGFPRAATKWLDRGALTALSYSRFWAQKQGKQATGQPGGFILDGAKATREMLIKDVKKGVLITRFWYIRSLDPSTILLTGLTRDGTFLIEDGAIAGPVNNFRFNESPVQMLAKVDGMTPAILTEGMRVPGLRTHEFNLASISEAV